MHLLCYMDLIILNNTHTSNCSCLSVAIWSEAGHEEDFLHHRRLEKGQVQIKSGCVWRQQGQDLSLFLLFPEAEVGAQHIPTKMQILLPTKLIHKG